MADKLGESMWTSFVKKLKLTLDDGPLVKALARLDKIDEAKPEPRLAALEETVEQVRKQDVALSRRRKELGDKTFGEVKDKLHEMLELAEKQQKDTQVDLADAKAKVKAKDAAEGDEEEDSPALLTGKMIPLLRELRKGESTMHALVCTAGKHTAVLVMRHPISTSRRKMLAEAVDAKGGAKYIVGECLYEDKVLTFVVQAPSAGLAKRVREALLRQTDLRLKVKVRGEDGEEHDGEAEADGDASPGAGPAQGTGGATAAATAPSADELACSRRLLDMEERLAQALRARHPEASKLRAVSGFASEKAAAGDFAGAGKALDMLDKLLAAPSSAPGGSPDPRPAAAKPVSSVVFQQSRLVWDATRKKAHAQLKDLQDAILSDFADEPEFDEVGTLAGRLDLLLERFDERLSDKLDEALNAADPELRRQRQREAAAVLDEYRAFVEGDAGLRLLDTNPFVPVTIQKGFMEALTLLGSKLSA